MHPFWTPEAEFLFVDGFHKFWLNDQRIFYFNQIGPKIKKWEQKIKNRIICILFQPRIINDNKYLVRTLNLINLISLEMKFELLIETFFIQLSVKIIDHRDGA
jgi:hypothetical protein